MTRAGQSHSSPAHPLLLSTCRFVSRIFVVPDHPELLLSSSGVSAPLPTRAPAPLGGDAAWSLAWGRACQPAACLLFPVWLGGQHVPFLGGCPLGGACGPQGRAGRPAPCSRAVRVSACAGAEPEPVCRDSGLRGPYSTVTSLKRLVDGSFRIPEGPGSPPPRRCCSQPFSLTRPCVSAWRGARHLALVEV